MTTICPARPRSCTSVEPSVLVDTSMPAGRSSTVELGDGPAPDRTEFEAAADLVRRAGNGEDDAWSEILRRYTPMLRGITRTCGLPPTVANDVIQTTWMRLAEGIGRIREPEALRTWLATVTRREAWRAASLSRRTTNAEDLDPLLPPAPSPENEVLLAERLEQLHSAIEELPDRQRAVILYLTADPAPSYSEIAEMTGMPIGSIGPTRARALARLRLQLDRDDLGHRRPALAHSHGPKSHSPSPEGPSHGRPAGLVEVAS